MGNPAGMRLFMLPLLILTLLCLGGAPCPAWADLIVPRSPPMPLRPPGLAAEMTPGLACRRAIASASRAAGIPDHLMAAIARVESGRRGADGLVNPWPWSINVEGADHIFETREQALAAVRGYQAQGIRSIDVGCMQVNIMHHPTAFASLEQAFDPAGNAAYAARFLSQLFAQTGTWPKAVAAYHSATPELGVPYQRKVMAVLAEESASDIALLGQMPGARGGLPGLTQGGGPELPQGGGALMLGNRAEAARVIPLAEGSMSRGLDAYRAAPVRVAGR